MAIDKSCRISIQHSNMVHWRAAGLNYINYSNITAQLLRRALKPEFRTEALRRNETSIKITKWKDGKPEPPMDRGNQIPKN